MLSHMGRLRRSWGKLLAWEYPVQGGEAHMKSNCPFLNFPTSFLTSDTIFGFDFGFMSTVVEVCPIFLATLEKDCVPEHNSRHLILQSAIKNYAKLLTPCVR